jgi:hypothetical protein
MARCRRIADIVAHGIVSMLVLKRALQYQKLFAAIVDVG